MTPGGMWVSEGSSKTALGSQYTLNSIDGPTPQSPFGDDWVLLWLDRCESVIDKDGHRRFFITNDSTILLSNYCTNYGDIPNRGAYDNIIQMMFANAGGVYLSTYILSYRGAQKVLFHLSMSLVTRLVDFGKLDMCRKNSRKFICWHFPSNHGQLLERWRFRE